MDNSFEAKIAAALQAKDVSFAHVLLHSAAGIYNHTPRHVRKEKLGQWSGLFPTLCTVCLKSCSQEGKRTMDTAQSLLFEAYEYLPSAMGVDGEHKKDFRDLLARIEKFLNI